MATAPVTQTRPIGKCRNVGVVILLAIITLGIYGIVYWYKTFEEVKEYRGKGTGGLAGLLLTWIIIGDFILAGNVGDLYEEDGKPKPVSAGTGWWIFLPLVGGIVYLVKVQGALNDFWKSKGAS